MPNFFEPVSDWRADIVHHVPLSPRTGPRMPIDGEHGLEPYVNVEGRQCPRGISSQSRRMKRSVCLTILIKNPGCQFRLAHLPHFLPTAAPHLRTMILVLPYVR